MRTEGAVRSAWRTGRFRGSVPLARNAALRGNKTPLLCADFRTSGIRTMPAFSRFTPLISALPATVPFVGPEAIERSRGLPVRARIGANENGFGPAPSAIEAMCAAAGETWKYTDPENFEIRKALAAHLGC